MVDYSKWDKFAVEDDSEDEGEEDSRQYGGNRKPQVTKLETPGKVTIGPQGTTIHCVDESILPNKQESVSKASKTVSQAEWSLNGGINKEKSLYWTQNKENVVIRLKIPITVKAKEIDVIHESNPSSKSRFKIQTKSEGVLLNGNLQHEIEHEDVLSDWEILTYESERYLEVNLRKKTIPGAILWWDRIFVDDAPIDLASIKGRNTSSATNVWEEAHRMFKERVSNRQIHHIDTNNDVNADTNDQKET